MKDKPFNPDELNLIVLAREYSDEDKARELFESMRWPHGAVCPHCQNHKEKPIYKLQPKPTSKSPLRKGVYKCGACRKQFTVTVGTILADSHIKIGTWMMALFIMCSSKKAVSSLQISRMLGITYKSAWFMMHRLRHSVTPQSPFGKLLKGVVEVDETFVGGKGFRCSISRRKTPVMALIERSGKMHTRVVPSVSQHNVGKVLAECVDKSATVHTDEHVAYAGPLKQWKAHHTVVHSKFEYSRKLDDGTKAGINTCESFFSLLKRGVYGAWHSVSREHLQKYSNEFAFRWNTRKLTDGARFATAIPMLSNKRLLYRAPLN